MPGSVASGTIRTVPTVEPRISLKKRRNRLHATHPCIRSCRKSTASHTNLEDKWDRTETEEILRLSLANVHRVYRNKESWNYLISNGHRCNVVVLALALGFNSKMLLCLRILWISTTVRDRSQSYGTKKRRQFAYTLANWMSAGHTAGAWKQRKWQQQLSSVSTNTCVCWGMKNQLDVTCYFISIIMRSTCFGH